MSQPWEKMLLPLHLIFCVCVCVCLSVRPAFSLHSITISNWFFMRPLLHFFLSKNVNAFQHCCSVAWVLGVREAGSGFVSSPSASPGAVCDPFCPLQPGCSVGFWGVHLKPGDGEGNARSLSKFCSMSCFSPSTCKTEITTLNPCVSEQCSEI